MIGIDLARLSAQKQVAVNYLDKAIEHDESDATRAFAAVEDARKHIQQMYVALHEAHIKTIRRVT